jgi:hypothetical protein
VCFVVNPSSSDTEPPTRSTRPTRSTSSRSVIPRPMTTVSSDPSGWSCSACALTWVVCPWVRPVTVSPASPFSGRRRDMTNVEADHVLVILVDGGWFCPCHGSHYDISGRIRRGPAPVSSQPARIARPGPFRKLTIACNSKIYSSTWRSPLIPSTTTRRSLSSVKSPVEMRWDEVKMYIVG